MSFEMTIEELETILDNGVNNFASTFTDYWKHCFKLMFTFESEGYYYEILVETGGNAEDVYRYSPESSDYDEHIGIIIDVIKADRKKKL